MDRLCPLSMEALDVALRELLGLDVQAAETSSELGRTMVNRPVGHSVNEVNAHAVDGCRSAETRQQQTEAIHVATAIKRSLFNVVQRKSFKDRATGLTWEVKSSDGGLRDKERRYSNLGTGAADDTSGYVRAVNAIKLCGYDDWRLPTRNELMTVLNGDCIDGCRGEAEAEIRKFWCADGLSTDPAQAWFVGELCRSGWSYTDSRSSYHSVRLVRGGVPSEERFTYSTEPYGTDGPNNVVNDAWTGLRWRRCEEGRWWDGRACVGEGANFTHGQALEHARRHCGWRLPDIRELTSLTDLAVKGGGARIDPAAFPGARADCLISSSLFVHHDELVWCVCFDRGRVDVGYGSHGNTVRLVRAGT